MVNYLILQIKEDTCKSNSSVQNLVIISVQDIYNLCYMQCYLAREICFVLLH